MGETALVERRLAVHRVERGRGPGEAAVVERRVTVRGLGCGRREDEDEAQAGESRSPVHEAVLLASLYKRELVTASRAGAHSQQSARDTSVQHRVLRTEEQPWAEGVSLSV